MRLQDSCVQYWGTDSMCFAIPWHPCFCSNCSVTQHRVRKLWFLEFGIETLVYEFFIFWCFIFLLCRNSKWKFLDGVKISGAPPPRKVIVQQCICDLGILELLCNYVSVCFASKLSDDHRLVMVVKQFELYLVGLFHYLVMDVNEFWFFCHRHHLQRNFSLQGLRSAFVPLLLLKF